MKLADLVKLILRANRAGRPPREPWEVDTEAKDAKRFTDQLAHLLPQHAEEIRALASRGNVLPEPAQRLRVCDPVDVRVQVWCDTYGCEFARVITIKREQLKRDVGCCPECEAECNLALVSPFVYVHPNLFDCWTLESPSQEAAEAKFSEVWTERTAEGGDCSHLTSSTFEQGKVMAQDDYEAE